MAQKIPGNPGEFYSRESLRGVIRIKSIKRTARLWRRPPRSRRPRPGGRGCRRWRRRTRWRRRRRCACRRRRSCRRSAPGCPVRGPGRWRALADAADAALNKRADLAGADAALEALASNHSDPFAAEVLFFGLRAAKGDLGGCVAAAAHQLRNVELAFLGLARGRGGRARPGAGCASST